MQHAYGSVDKKSEMLDCLRGPSSRDRSQCADPVLRSNFAHLHGTASVPLLLQEASTVHQVSCSCLSLYNQRLSQLDSISHKGCCPGSHVAGDIDFLIMAPASREPLACGAVLQALLASLLQQGLLLNEMSPNKSRPRDTGSATWMGLCRPAGSPHVRRIDFKVYPARCDPCSHRNCWHPKHCSIANWCLCLIYICLVCWYNCCGAYCSLALGNNCLSKVKLKSWVGQNLEDLFSMSGRRFSLKTVLMLADQLICRVQYMHEIVCLYCELKPGFSVGGLLVVSRHQAAGRFSGQQLTSLLGMQIYSFCSQLFYWLRPICASFAILGKSSHCKLGSEGSPISKWLQANRYSSGTPDYSAQTATGEGSDKEC